MSFLGKFKRLILLVFFFTFSFIANSYSNTCCNYPTKWAIGNLTNDKIFIDCVNSSVTQYSLKLKMELPLLPQQVREHLWSKWEYNDGLGLTAGHWVCAAGLAKDPLSDSRNLKSKISTNWGENIHLQIKPFQNNYLVEKK